MKTTPCKPAPELTGPCLLASATCSVASVHFSSATVEWATPPEFFDRLNALHNFTLDPCCTHENAKCVKHYTIAENGLAQSWQNERAFMNPPYGNPEWPCKTNCKKKSCQKRGYHNKTYKPGIVDWMKKAYMESRGSATVVCLVPARTDTAWWHRYAAKGEVEFVEGRLKFGGHKNSAPFPSAVVTFKPQNDQAHTPRK